MYIYRILLLHQHGLIEEAKRRILLFTGNDSKDVSHRPLSLGDVSGTFIVLGIGYCLAILAFILEKIKLSLFLG